MGKTIKARYAGECRGCGLPFQAGEGIYWAGKGETYHSEKSNCRPSGDERADSEYYAGLNDAARYQAEKAAMGKGWADHFQMLDEQARYDAGEDY